MKTKKNNIEEVDEKFVLKDVKSLDKRNRVSIGAEIIRIIERNFDKVDSFKIFLGEDGDILLRPAVNIPSRELWLYKNPKAMNMVRRGLKDAKEGKTEKVEDLDKYLEEL